MNGTQVSVFEETYQISLAGFLQGHDGRALEAKVSLEVLSYLSDQALEGQLADEELRAFLVATDLSECNGSRAVPMGFLHSPGSWGTLPGCLGGKLLARSFSSGGLTCCLLCTSHRKEVAMIRCGAIGLYIYSLCRIGC